MTLVASTFVEKGMPSFGICTSSWPTDVSEEPYLRWFLAETEWLHILSQKLVCSGMLAMMLLRMGGTSRRYPASPSQLRI